MSDDEGDGEKKGVFSAMWDRLCGVTSETRRVTTRFQAAAKDLADAEHKAADYANHLARCAADTGTLSSQSFTGQLTIGGTTISAQEISGTFPILKQGVSGSAPSSPAWTVHYDSPGYYTVTGSPLKPSCAIRIGGFDSDDGAVFKVREIPDEWPQFRQLARIMLSALEEGGGIHVYVPEGKKVFAEALSYLEKIEDK